MKADFGLPVRIRTQTGEHAQAGTSGEGVYCGDLHWVWGLSMVKGQTWSGVEDDLGGLLDEAASVRSAK